MTRNVFHDVGYEIAVEIHPESYALTTTGDGVGYARSFTEDRDVLEAMLREIFPHAADRTVRPGYLHVRTPGVGLHDDPDTAVGRLRGIVERFNEREATPAPDGGYLDALTLGETYVGVYQPDSGGGVEGFLDAHLDRDAYPEELGEDRVLEWTPDHSPDTSSGRRHVAYTVAIPFWPETFEQDTGLVPVDHSGFRWGDLDRERFSSKAARHFRDWSAGSVELVELHPRHARVTLASAGLRWTPQDIAFGALASLSGSLPRAVDLGNEVYVTAIDPPTGGGVGAWIDAEGLEAVDGEPYEPEPEDPEGGGVLGNLKSFGGGG